MNPLSVNISLIVFIFALVSKGENKNLTNEENPKCIGVYSSYGYACKVSEVLGKNGIKTDVREKNDAVILVRECDLKKARNVFLENKYKPVDDEKIEISSKRWKILLNRCQSDCPLLRNLYRLIDNNIDFKFLFIDKYYDVKVYENEVKEALKLMQENNLDRGRMEKELIVNKPTEEGNNRCPSREDMNSAVKSKFGGFLMPRSEIEALIEKEELNRMNKLNNPDKID